MSDAVSLLVGSPVTCHEGACGELVRVVVDPVARTVTHIVVEPRHGQGQGRLVPVDLIDEGASGIRLRCSTDVFDHLEYAEETHFVSAAGQDLGYGEGEVLAWPYYYGMGAETGGAGIGPAPRSYFASRVPAGDVEVRRGEPVHASDGEIGRVQGLVVSPGDHHVTHVLLEEGHLWGKKALAIPIACVKEVAADGVRITLTKDQVRDLPSVDYRRPS